MRRDGVGVGWWRKGETWAQEGGVASEGRGREQCVERKELGWAGGRRGNGAALAGNVGTGGAFALSR